MAFSAQDVARMGPNAQKQILQKLSQQQIQKQSKYHNQKDERQVEGKTLHFDSKKEARRFDELMLLLKAGEIHDLKLQPDFTLREAYTTPEGNRVQAIRYRADFSYERDGEKVVEDVKSRATKTRVYSIKKKLMREVHGIEISEV